MRGLGGQRVELFGRSEAFAFSLNSQLFFLDHVHSQQNPRNSRRNLLPMKCINRSLLMGHEHVSRALVELMQIGKTPSGADPVLHHPPEPFDGIEMVATMSRQ